VRFVSSTYDQENRLIRVTTANGNRSEFSYDGMSRRVETREYQANSLMLTTRYVYDGNEYSYDGNGNVRDIISASGLNVAHYEYDPFGKETVSSGSYSSQPYQWSSKEFHQPSGMVYYLYRFYAPQLGRWINRDPIEEAGGINLYGFVGNDGISRWDYLGQDFFKDYADWWIASHIDNPWFFVNWIAGTLPEENTYNKNSTGAPGRLWDSLKNSDGYQSMLDAYKAKNCPDTDNGGYGHFASYAANFKIVILHFNAANFQVGGFYWEAKKVNGMDVQFTVYNSANVGSLIGLNTLMDTLGLSKNWIPTGGVKVPGTNHRLAREVKQQFLYKENCLCPKK